MAFSIFGQESKLGIRHQRKDICCEGSNTWDFICHCGAGGWEWLFSGLGTQKKMLAIGEKNSIYMAIRNFY